MLQKNKCPEIVQCDTSYVWKIPMSIKAVPFAY
jgi:hypothetical protein